MESPLAALRQSGLPGHRDDEATTPRKRSEEGAPNTRSGALLMFACIAIALATAIWWFAQRPG
jgi:hypothetical protein